MNLQQLYYFQAISRLKNYTKAAEQLLVAQSSLSHSIGDLERELGVPLFFKSSRWGGTSTSRNMGSSF